MSLILVTGATGYIGGRLVRRLVAAGKKVRCLARNPERLQRRFGDRIEAVRGDVADPDSLREALRGCEAAYYLVHAMAGSEFAFEDRDREWAKNFSNAAAEAANHGFMRIIYLGGLGKEDESLSKHLRSRHEVGEILRQSGVPVTEFRAAVIIGSGSASFEILRYLTDRLPVMICPRWVKTRCQPIAMADVQRYLVEALDTPESAGRVIEIGGSDILTYGQMIRGYAKLRGLHRVLITVPFLTPRLSSYWVDLVTPLPASLARPLIDGLATEVIVQDDSAREIFKFSPMSYTEAVKRALMRLHNDEVETSWFDAVHGELQSFAYDQLHQRDGMIVERRTSLSDAPPEKLYAAATCVGGTYGWPYAGWLFWVRGMLDRMCGGPGMRRGRRSMTELRCGDVLDFWRVEKCEPGHELLLRAEMKMPGAGWLKFETIPEGKGSRLVQTAFFEPQGVHGLVYWYTLYPMHQFIFSGMAREIARRANATMENRNVVA